MLVSDTVIIMCVINNLEHNDLTNRNKLKCSTLQQNPTLYACGTQHNQYLQYVKMSCEKMLLLSGRHKFIVD